MNEDVKERTREEKRNEERERERERESVRVCAKKEWEERSRDSHVYRQCKKKNDILIILRGTNRTVIFYCINLRRTKRIERERERERVREERRRKWREWNEETQISKRIYLYYTVVETRAGYYCILQRSASLSHLKKE